MFFSHQMINAILQKNNIQYRIIKQQILIIVLHNCNQKNEGYNEKNVFKTFKEISQLEIIQQASIRQKYIDQAQSLNLNIPANLPVKDVNNLIIEAWKLGVKTLYYQRSQSVSKEMVTNLVSCSSCEG